MFPKSEKTNKQKHFIPVGSLSFLEKKIYNSVLGSMS
jgi:hypothetical protein